MTTFQKLYSFNKPVTSIYTSTQSSTVIILLDDSLYTPHGIIESVKQVMCVRITADGMHWVAALRMADDRYLVMVDGNEVASYSYIYGSCAAISEDGKCWAVFADTEKGEYCLVIEGIIHGPFFDSPPGAGYNAQPLVFDEKNVLWCPVKINETDWVLSRDGEVASEVRQLWRDIEFTSGCMTCRSVKDNKWYVHLNDQEWGPFETSKKINLSPDKNYIAFAAKDDQGEFVLRNDEIIYRDKRVMLHSQIANDGKLLVATENKRQSINFEDFYQQTDEFNSDAYCEAAMAYEAAHRQSLLTTHIHFGDWVSDSFEHCVALAMSKNGQHIAFVADRDNVSFVGNQKNIWGPFQNVLLLNPLVLDDGRVAWINNYENDIALFIDDKEILRVDAIYSELQEIDNGIGFVATKNNEVFWVSVCDQNNLLVGCPSTVN